VEKGRLPPVADPEILARGGELRRHNGGRVRGGGCAPPLKIFEFKSKNGAFLYTFKR